MKKNVFLVLFFLFSVSCFGKDLKDYYNASISVINKLNIAKSILFGNIELLDNEELDDYSLALLNKNELRILYNSIYARYGYTFLSEDLTNYFNNFDWYFPKKNNVDENLTVLDKKNLEKIKLFEQGGDISCTNNIFFDSFGDVWSKDIVVPSAYSDNFIFDKNIVKFKFNENKALKILVGYNGKYTIENGKIIIYADELIIHMPNTDFEKNGYNGFDWIGKENTTINLDKPILLTFPISKIENVNLAGLDRTRVLIGSTYYYLH